MLDSIISLSLGQWGSLIFVVLVAYFAKNRFTRGLQKYPGPFLASLTDWWRFIDVMGRRPDITHIKLHRELGDIVRLGPNSLSFADPKALKTIYGLNKGFIKVCSIRYLQKSTQVSRLSVRVLPCSASNVKGRAPAFSLFHY